MATKTEKMRFWIVAHSKWGYVGKVPKLIFEKLTQKLISILKHFSLEKYLKIVFLTDNVWKIVKIKIEKTMKIKKGSNKKIVFSQPLEHYVVVK